jgi:hypothetical protein
MSQLRLPNGIVLAIQLDSFIQLPPAVLILYNTTRRSVYRQVYIHPAEASRFASDLAWPSNLIAAGSLDGCLRGLGADQKAKWHSEPVIDPNLNRSWAQRRIAHHFH